MFGSLVVAFCSFQATSPKVTFQDGAFTVSGAQGADKVPVGASQGLNGTPGGSRDKFQTVIEGKTVTFDAKGLTIEVKGHKATSRLNAVPTSGKIATKESNAELVKLVSEGKRKLEVSALSGWEQVGSVLYLLARWDGKDKQPWLEALLSVDLNKDKPQAQLVGRFKGTSFAQGVTDDVLTMRSDKLAVLTNDGDEFGISRMKTDGSDVTFEALGSAVGKAKFSEDGSTAWSLSPTDYGTNVLGVADLDYGDYRVVTEVRGKMTGVLPPAYAKFKSSEGLKMVNLMTGAMMSVPADTGQQQTTSGLLVWSPSKDPHQASLFDPSFRRLATWSAPPAAAPVARPPVARSAARAATGIVTKAPAKKPAKPAVKGKSPAKSVAKKPTKPLVKGKASVKTVKRPATKAPVKKPAVKSNKPKPGQLMVEVTTRKASGKPKLAKG